MKDILMDGGLDIKDLGTRVDSEDFIPTFDPATELSSSDWESLNSYLVKLRRAVQRKNGREPIFDNAVRASLELQLLTGKRADLTKITDYKLVQWALFHMKEGPVGYAVERVRGGVNELIANLLLLDPALRSDLDLEIHKAGLEAHFKESPKDDQYYSLECFCARVILGEGNFMNLLSIDGQPFFNPRQVKDCLLDRWNPHMLIFGPATSPDTQVNNILSELFGSWTKALVCAKTLVPSLPKGFELNDERWAVLKQWLGVQRDNGNWRRFLELATNMFLLSADKLEITDDGLRITKRVETLQVVENLPSIRSYA